MIINKIEDGLNLDKKGISPLIGTILIIIFSIVIIGSITIFITTYDTPSPTPTVKLRFEDLGDKDNIFHIYNDAGTTISNASENILIKVENSVLNDDSDVTFSGSDNDFGPGESMKIVVSNLELDGKIKVIHKPSNGLIGESKKIFKSKSFESGTVSSWGFDGSSDTAIKDGVGDNVGEIYGASKCDGVIGSALNFDGKNDYVKIPFDESLNVNGSNLSLKAWLNGI